MEKQEYTLPMHRVNRIALLLALPEGLLLGALFYGIQGINPLQLSLDNLGWQFYVVLFLGIPAHELLHGITFAFFAKRGFKAIRFGVNWQALAPYCHCKEPLQVKHYRLGAAMPLVVLGILPLCWSYVSGSSFYFFFGLFYIWVAGGDVISLAMLRKLPAKSCVSDHPTEMGFILEEEK